MFLVIVFSILCVASLTASQWTIYRRADLRNKDGHNLRFDSNRGGAVQAWLILGRIVNGVFASKLPLYQVDDKGVHDLQVASKILTDKEKQRWIRWEISKDGAPVSKALSEFMNGKQVVFQFYQPDGTIKETTFLLEGAKAAINEILRE